jgi:hypothetical protein
MNRKEHSMYRLLQRHLAVLAFTASLALTACGGGSDTPPAAGGVSYGVIASGGGLTVNGVAFGTTNANIVVDGVGSRPQTELKAGRVARVSGSFSGRSGEASEVRMDAILEGHAGPRAPSPLGGIITVRDQMISVDDSTVIVSTTGVAASFADIASDGRLSVHGFPDDSGTIRATRIEILPGTLEDIEVKGFVSNLNVGAKTFTLKVTPTSATSFAVTLAAGASLPAGIANGSFVEVHSDQPPSTVNGPTIVDATVTLEDAKLGANAEAEIEGLVVSGDSSSFVIQGTTVVTTGSTVFENGVAGDVLPGVKVEAEGTLDGAGVLHARKVSLRANLRLQGVPTAVTSPTFQLLGKTVHIDAFTEGPLPDTTNAFEVRARLHANGTDLVAERIVDRGSDNKLFVQGPVTSSVPASNTLTILGITVNVGGASLKDQDDSVFPNAAAFFAKVSTGTVVKARGNGPGSLSGTTLTADQAEIEGSR